MNAPPFHISSLARRTTEALVLRDLRRTFRRILWVGDGTELDRETNSLPAKRRWASSSSVGPSAIRPLVLFANHHSFYDGYLLWLIVRRILKRRMILWMERWEQAPMFGTVGALPFPADDQKQRYRTLRETARRLSEHPETVLVLFPEGELRPSDAGLGPMRTDFRQLARILPANTLWWPVGMRITWWGEDRPTALLTASDLIAHPSGEESEALERVLETLRNVPHTLLQNGGARLILEGRKSAEERWNLERLAPLFRRWT